MDLINIEQLSVDSRVRDVSFNLCKGEMLGLIGPNGAGKSTLLNAIVGIEASEGNIFLKGSSIESYSPKQRARIIGLQPQSINSAWSLNVRDVVALGRMPWGDEENSAIDTAIIQANITEFTDRKVTELSGGERARVWMARVLAGQPDIILADEPISHLDIHYQLEVMNLLRSFSQNECSTIVALHDLSLAARYCDRLCLLRNGRIHAIGTPANVLTNDNLTACYGIEVEIDLHRQPPVVVPL